MALSTSPPCVVSQSASHTRGCLPSTVLTGYFGSPARQSASTGSTKPTQRLPRTKATRKFGLKKQREGVCVSWLDHNKKTRPCIPDASERPMDTHSLQSCLGRKKCEKTQRKQRLGHVMGSSMRSAKKNVNFQRSANHYFTTSCISLNVQKDKLYSNINVCINRLNCCFP